MRKQIAVIGECMLELNRQSDKELGRSLPMTLSYGGDTLNSAVYLARQGVEVDYVTSLGDDSLSSWMLGQWKSEGIGCKLIDRYPDSVPGIYPVETDDSGERSFHYWRDNAPAKRLFDDPEKAVKLFEKLGEYEWLCLSGITLAIYSESSRQRFFQLLSDYRMRGGKVIFDSNYRPKLWSGNATTQETYESMYRLTDLALPTIEDEQMLFKDAGKDAIIERLRSWGVSEIVLKMGDQGCWVFGSSEGVLVPTSKVKVLDTTSAGDSFNAGYLAALLNGSSPPAAAENGHRLASAVIQHRGAIIPIDAMPESL